MRSKLLFVPTILCFLLSTCVLMAQDTSNDNRRPYQVLEPSSVNKVSSIASRIDELPAVDLLEDKEVQDGRGYIRNRGIDVVPGKGSSGNDPLATLQRNAQQIPNRVPELVFETAASNSQPTDPAGAVGPNHYIAVTNTAFRIFDKNGNPLTPLLPPNPSIFPNGGCCDLTASYDNVADRWVLSFLGAGAQIAVSNGPDPVNDGWTVYNYATVTDYQKLSVWHDGYYMTDNANGTFHVFERDEMLLGNPGAQLVSFSPPEWQSAGFDAAQFVNLSHDATVTGPATLVHIADDSWASVSQADHIKLWSVTMNWAIPINSIVSNPVRLGVDSFGFADGTVTPFTSTFDGGAFNNLSQPAGGSSIDALQWIVMNQAQFRKFPTHNSVVFNFVVDTDGTPGKLAGIRWYELRQTAEGQPWTIYQEGTYSAPDGRHAWNASMIMDLQGNIGMGYTSMSGPTSSRVVRVGSYYTGQSIGSSGSGIMDISEEVILAGNGNIPGVRYGDYSKIDIDPANDKKFWFVNELMNNGRKNVCGVFQLAPNTTNDVGVISVDTPIDGDLTAAETITVTVFNYGQSDASGFNVTYQIDSGGIVSEAFPGILPAGASAQFTFSTTANLSIEGQIYNIIACTDYSTDEDNTNDCISSNVTHILSNDLAITAITAPTTTALGANEVVTVTIENLGSSDQSGFNVTYTIDGGGLVTETVSSNVPAGGSLSYSFAQTADLSTQGQTYSIEACTSLGADQNPANDCLISDVTNQLIVCEPTGDCSFGDGITMFELGTIDVNSVPCTSGYVDLTSNTTDLDRSTGNNIHNGILQTGWSEEHLSMWIDFNDNGDFTDPGELVLDTFIVPPGGDDVDQAFTITIPTDANLGSHLLRVRGYDPVFSGTLNDPCDNLQYGNTVDMTVVVIDSALSIDDFEKETTELNIISKPNNQFEIVLSTPYAEDLTFNLYNMLGQQLVYGVISKDNQGKYVYDLDMSYASSGNYIVKVGRGTSFKTGKIIVK